MYKHITVVARAISSHIIEIFVQSQTHVGGEFGREGSGIWEDPDGVCNLGSDGGEPEMLIGKPATLFLKSINRNHGLICRMSPEYWEKAKGAIRRYNEEFSGDKK